MTGKTLWRCLATFLVVGVCGCRDATTQPVDSAGRGIPVSLGLLGQGSVTDRYTAELWVRGTTAYTSTWGTRGTTPGNAVKIWDVSGNSPQLVDSVIVSAAITTGDIQVSDDGSLLAVAIEPRPSGALALYSLANPRKPELITQYSSPNVQNGVHTAEIARVNGKLYAFCAVDPANLIPGKLVILDLSNPAVPVEVAVLAIGAPLTHDVFVRNGLLFTAEWNDGLGIWDIGAMSGSPSNPIRLGSVRTVGGQVHNVWWFNDPSDGSKRYVFVGQEGPGEVGSTSTGDIHVVDVSNMSAPVEVAAYSVTGAGVHNFSMDESRGLLYAAYYNGGIRVLNVQGNLANCAAGEKTTDGRCDLRKMGREVAYVNRNAVSGPSYVWGVHFQGGALYASDMITGLWKFAPP